MRPLVIIFSLGGIFYNRKHLVGSWQSYSIYYSRAKCISKTWQSCSIDSEFLTPLFRWKRPVIVIAKASFYVPWKRFNMTITKKWQVTKTKLILIKVQLLENNSCLENYISWRYKTSLHTVLFFDMEKNKKNKQINKQR